tara:strand:+ start:4187 stop:4429 length:243 start_codon:yes stop_codon:yes gene_type:complete
MSDSWEKHQEHVLSELQRLGSKIEDIDKEMKEFHTNHLSGIKGQVAEIRATVRLYGVVAVGAGPFAVGIIEVYLKMTGKG